MQQDNYLYVRVWGGVLLQLNDKFLLVQEGSGGFTHGKWGIPGGRVEVNHTLEESAIREVKEEVGLDIELVKEIGVFHPELDRPVQHVFLGKCIGGELQYQTEELMDAKWLTIEEIKSLHSDMRFPWLVDLVNQLSSE